MSDSTTIRGEDGRFAAQPPKDDPTTSQQDNVAQDASAAEAGEKAPARQDAAIDPYEAAAKDLKVQVASDTVVSEPAPAKPAEQSPKPVQQNTGPAQSPPPSPSADADAAALKPYGDMSANTYALLKSVGGGLVTPDEWKAMDVTERVDHVRAVTDFRNNQKRQFNQRQQQGTQATPAAPAPTPQRPTELSQPPTAQGARVSGQLPADVQQDLDAMTAAYGSEDPLVKAYAAQAQRTIRLEAQLAERQNRDQQSAAQAQQEQFWRNGEDQIFDQMETKYPSLADPRERDRLRQICRDWHEVQAKHNQNVNDVELIQTVVHRELFNETQKRQAQRDQDKSKEIRRGSFDRGAPTAPRSKQAATAGADPYAVVADALNGAHSEGLSGDNAIDRSMKIAAAQR